MTCGDNQTQLQAEIAAIAARIQTLATEHRSQPHELLQVLRFLESLHREIREGLFQEALPTNRQALYALLRDIEAKGGWPYISRMKLSELLEHLTHPTQGKDQDEKSANR